MFFFYSFRMARVFQQDISGGRAGPTPGPGGSPGCVKATSLPASSAPRCCTRLAGGDATRPYQGALTPSAVGTQDGPNWYQSTALGLADVRARSLASPGSIFLEDLLQYSQPRRSPTIFS